MSSRTLHCSYPGCKRTIGPADCCELRFRWVSTRSGEHYCVEHQNDTHGPLPKGDR